MSIVTTKKIAVLVRKDRASFHFEVGQTKDKISIPNPTITMLCGRSPSIGETFL